MSMNGAPGLNRDQIAPADTVEVGSVYLDAKSGALRGSDVVRESPWQSIQSEHADVKCNTGAAAAAARNQKVTYE
ncbi:hypothetical protein ElyMa_005333000 [Elysia marginata]|uniref:Uncharacterized protein n=1 Tax=Elysia marginata TaxID=1093978 RepID=A0AAV4K0R1_9GAST|nr:hypothetical protein ElyMa_005333000 [Elysia marginata]